MRRMSRRDLGWEALWSWGLPFPALAPMSKSGTARGVTEASNIHRLYKQMRSSGKQEQYDV